MTHGVRVLLFARLRELVGQAETRVVIDGSAPTPRSVWERLVIAHPRLHGADAGLRVAINEEYAGWNDPIAPTDTVAFVPPVAGGATELVSGVHAAVSATPLDIAAVEALIGGPGDGAMCTFVGRVRGDTDGRRTTHLEYEAYGPMAEAEMRRLGKRVLERFAVTAIAMVHRTGLLAVGEPSVVVAVAAPHRDAAFAACREAIDALKSEVPIWKCEHGPDGKRWVDEAHHGG